MPLPLTISCPSKSRFFLSFWYQLTWVVTYKRLLNGWLLLSSSMSSSFEYIMHTHTHTTILRLSWILSETTWMSRRQKGKTSFRKVKPIWIYWSKDSEWPWHQLDHMQICTLTQTHNHASIPPLSFLQAGCPSCRTTNSVKAMKALYLHWYS